MVIHGGGQVRDLCRRSAGPRLSCLIVETDEGVLVSNKELVTDQRQAIRCIQVLGKDSSFFVYSISVLIPQQGQTVATGGVGYPPCLYYAGDQVFGRQGRVGSPSSFGNQDIPIWQYQGLTRDLKVGSDCSN